MRAVVTFLDLTICKASIRISHRDVAIRQTLLSLSEADHLRCLLSPFFSLFELRPGTEMP